MNAQSGGPGQPLSPAIIEGILLQWQEENAQLRQTNNAQAQSIQDLLQVNALQGEQIATLTKIVQELQSRLNKDSHNSGKPPSSDGLKKKPAPKTQRGKSGKPSGGQPGHPGSTLRMQDNPDHIVVHVPQTCDCGASLTDVPTAEQYDHRQVFDLPPMRLEVTEHRILQKICPGCGQTHHGEFPTSVLQPVQYGERIKGLAVYLTSYQLLPWERTTQMMADLFGATLGEATLQRAQQECRKVVTPLCEQIKQTIISSECVHFDETGQRIAGKLHWLHVACTSTLTYYGAHLKRGCAALDAIGILPLFQGRAVHDGWICYQRYGCDHSLCNAHHLRELDFLSEQYGQVWAARFKVFVLLAAKRAVDHAKAMGLRAVPPDKIKQIEAEYDRLLEQGDQANPKQTHPKQTHPKQTHPKQTHPQVERACGRGITSRGRAKQTPGYNMVRRLERRDQVLAFLYDLAIPFDNNQAERDVRMMKVRQKVSGCFRTLDGAHTFNTIRGYLSTMRKQGHNILRVLEAVFHGTPTTPAFA